MAQNPITRAFLEQMAKEQKSRSTIENYGGTAIGHGGEFEQPLQILIGLVFSSVSSPDKLSHPGVRPIRLLLLALSPTSSRHDTPTTSRFGGSQAETGGNGYESTSRAVHRRCVLPAAMAGVRCR